MQNINNCSWKAANPVREMLTPEELRKVLTLTHKSRDTKTYKKSAAAKIMGFYTTLLAWALRMLEEILVCRMMEKTGNVDLPTHSSKLVLIQTRFADFFACYSSVIFKQEMAFELIPFRDLAFLIVDLNSVMRKYPELEGNVKDILAVIFNRNPQELNLIKINDIASRFYKDILGIYNVKPVMDGEAFYNRIRKLAFISAGCTLFLKLIIKGWLPAWDEQGLAQYLTQQLRQVHLRSNLTDWLWELVMHIKELKNIGKLRYDCFLLFEYLGISPDSDFATRDGSLKLLLPDTYKGDDDFGFLFSE